MSSCRLVSAAGLAALASLAACTGGGGGGDCGGIVAPVRTLTPSVAALELDVSATARLGATLAGGCAGEPTSVRWQSADPAIADVDTDGTVRARAPGTTSITGVAFDETARAVVPVTVRPLVPTRLVASPQRDTLAPGETRVLAAVVRDQRDSVVADAPLAWRSLAPSVATVDGSGRVSGVASGSARVVVSTPRAALDSLRDTVLVDVIAPAAPPPTCGGTRTVAVPGTTDGRLDATCAGVGGLPAGELLRWPGGSGALSALIEFVPSVPGVPIPLRVAGALRVGEPVAAGATGRAIVVVGSAWRGASTVGLGVATVAVPPATGMTWRIVATANPDPSRHCVVTYATPGTDFTTALGAGCASRYVRVAPSVASGETLVLRVTTDARATVQAIEDGGAGRVLRTETTGSRGGTVSITVRGTSAGVPVRLRIAASDAVQPRVRITLDD